MLKLFKKKTDDPKKELQEVLGDTELPSFPAIITSALDRLRDEDADFHEIGELIVADPGLSVRLLGTVNSVAFALRHQVRSVHHAVSLLGRTQLESILISLAARGALPSDPGRGFETQRFWHTSAQRATTATALAELIDPAGRSESFTASLLQDLAIPILSRHKGDTYGAVLEQWHGGTDDLAQIEREAFGWDHACVAGWICQEWQFPEKIIDAIGAHHGLEEDELAALPAVHLVAALREVDEEVGVERLVEIAHERFQIPKDKTVELARESFDAATELAQLFT